VSSVATALAAADRGEVLLARMVSVPDQTPPSLVDSHLDPVRETVRKSVATVSEPDGDFSTHAVVRIGHGSTRLLAGTAADYDVTTLVTRQDDRSRFRFRFPSCRTHGERLWAATSSRVVVASDSRNLSDPSSILVPIAGGPHSGAGIDVAHALAKRHDAWVELLHVVPPDARSDRRETGERVLARGIDRLGDDADGDTWLLEAEDVVDAIVEQSVHYDLTILGAPRQGRLRRFVFGSTTGAVRDRARSGVLTVWSERADPSLLGRWVGGRR
jgi:nucleotide-binding universal stress UspA family protein